METIDLLILTGIFVSSITLLIYNYISSQFMLQMKIIDDLEVSLRNYIDTKTTEPETETESKRTMRLGPKSNLLKRECLIYSSPISDKCKVLSIKTTPVVYYIILESKGVRIRNDKMALKKFIVRNSINNLVKITPFAYSSCLNEMEYSLDNVIEGSNTGSFMTHHDDKWPFVVFTSTELPSKITIISSENLFNTQLRIVRDSVTIAKCDSSTLDEKVILNIDYSEVE